VSPDLLHPSSTADVADMLAASSAEGRRVLIVGGRRHLDKGNPAEVDLELWTTQLDQVVAYDPAEMLVVVQAGMRCGALATLLAEHGQEWPADAPADATVGGVIASGSSSARRMHVGAIRDTVVGMELVTGDGRIVHSGARTVKNVTGYDVHRLMTGSLGTLGVITQVALKLRPLPERRRTMVASGDLALARTIAAEVPLVAGVLGTQDGVEVRLEGWSDEIEELTAAVVGLAGDAVPSDDDAAFPRTPWWTWLGDGTILEVSVVPSLLPRILAESTTYAALAGVGIAWVGASDTHEVAAVRRRVEAVGGIAPAIRGPGGLGGTLPGSAVHRRLKTSFDPANVLAPGRAWTSGTATA
jgi:glycolate oxidase FAD binding subunit